MMYRIECHCKIKKDTVSVQGADVFKSCENPGTSKHFKEIYTSLGLSYPKFYKMDMLSKLAFLASEYLLKDIREKLSETETAILLSNRNSTVNVDRKYIESIDEEKYFPNPAYFVYTLPNVMIGEISIRNNLKGETLFVQNSSFSGNIIQQYLDSMVFKNAICGFIEYFDEFNFEAFLAFIERDEKNGIMSISEELDRLYNNF
jgi:hypothetical protein